MNKPELPPKESGLNPLTGHKHTHIQKGEVRNPYGKPRGAISKKKAWNVADRLRYRHKRNPLDELIMIADQLRLNGKLEEAADIWKDIQKYNEPAKKAIEAKEPTPESSRKAAENTLDLMKELEKEFENADTRATGKGNTPSLERGAADIQAKAGPEGNLQDRKGE